MNETDVQEYIDIDFPDNFDPTNRAELLNFLRKAGFIINGEEREMDVVVISDKK